MSIGSLWSGLNRDQCELMLEWLAQIKRKGFPVSKSGKRCSICGRWEGQVHRILYGPGGIKLCNVCAGMVHDLLEEGAQPSAEAASLAKVYDELLKLYENNLAIISRFPNLEVLFQTALQHCFININFGEEVEEEKEVEKKLEEPEKDGNRLGLIPLKDYYVNEWGLSHRVAMRLAKAAVQPQEALEMSEEDLTGIRYIGPSGAKEIMEKRRPLPETQIQQNQ